MWITFIGRITSPISTVNDMSYIPFSVIKAIHDDIHSAEPHAPVRPYRPLRDRAVVRVIRRLFVLPEQDVCQAEDRDRGTTVAGPARAC